MKSLSVSQIEKFDHKQKGGCERRWWFENVHGLKPDQDDAQSEGEAGHQLLADYFSSGAMPGKRVKMGKAVTGAILKGILPAPGPDLMVETRFDGQPKTDVNGQWLPLVPEKTLWLAGVPLDGFIDLRFRRGEIPEVGDHKFSTDIDLYARKATDLIRTVQMPVYVLDSLRIWPDAREWKIWHHNVSRRGVASFIRSAVVPVSGVLERKADIEAVIERMKVAELATSQDDVPFNRKSCSAWMGCPMQSHCRAYKENKMSLSAEEQALFADLDGLEVEAPTEAAPPPVPKSEAVLGFESSPAPSVQAEDTQAAKIARMEAELAKLKAPAPAVAAPAAAPKRSLKIDDSANPAGDAVAPQIPDSGPAIPPPQARPPAPPMPPCADCGAALSPENASRLQSGVCQHIGCPAKAPPPEVKAEPKKRAPKPPPPPPAAPPAPPAPVEPPAQAPASGTASSVAAVVDAVRASSPIRLTFEFQTMSELLGFLARR